MREYFYQTCLPSTNVAPQTNPKPSSATSFHRLSGYKRGNRSVFKEWSEVQKRHSKQANEYSKCDNFC